MRGEACLLTYRVIAMSRGLVGIEAICEQTPKSATCLVGDLITALKTSKNFLLWCEQSHCCCLFHYWRFAAFYLAVLYLYKIPGILNEEHSVPQM